MIQHVARKIIADIWCLTIENYNRYVGRYYFRS